MTAQIKQNILVETQQYLLPIFNKNLKKIVLYGSYARNEENEESDIDILILTDLEDNEIKKLHKNIVDISVELSLKYDILVSFVAINNNKFKKFLDVLPLYQNISNEGIILYESR